MSVSVYLGEGCGVFGAWLWGLGGGGGGNRGRTLRVELENVYVAVCVCDGYVELFVRGEEGCCCDFDCVGGFAEGAELVGFFLYARSRFLVSNPFL